MGEDKTLSEKTLIRDVSRLIDKHGLPHGKTTITVSTKTTEDAVQCPPPTVPTLITITLANGTKVTTTICK
jgi:hypothetical protein